MLFCTRSCPGKAVPLQRISKKARNGVPDVTRGVAVGRAEAPRTLMNLGFSPRPRLPNATGYR